MDFKLPDRNGRWMPLPRQEKFLYAPNKFGLYVGGVGSGKTMCGCYKSIMKSIEHPGGQGLIGAQVYPQLRDATMHTFWEICPEKLMYKGSKEKAFNKSEGILIMNNEHQILFRPLDDESKLRSLNLVWFWIDEASEVAEDIFLMLQSRLRSMKGYSSWIDDENNEPAHQGWVTTNPAGKDWLWKIFVAEADEDYFWVNAPTRENKYLPKGFEAGLRKKWNAQWISRFLDGSFDAFEGQIYPDFDVKIHCTIPYPHFEDHHHRIPEGWHIIVSLDHGVTNPTAIGLFVVDPYNRVLLIDEIYENNKPTIYYAQKIREMLVNWGVTQQHVSDWLIDPSTRGQRGMEGRAVIDEYADHGIFFRPANNQVQAGILQTVEYLMPDPLSEPFPNMPSLLIHPRCKNSIRELGGYKWKPRTAASHVNDPEEPLKKDDHTCDMIRYTTMTRPKITLGKFINPFESVKQARGEFSLNEKNLPYALRSGSNWNKGQQANYWKW
jgi:phage terminase large subunit